MLAIKMNDLQIKLMYEEALGRLNDAEILSKSINRETDSNYLLELLAFELLLKCTLCIYIGKHIGGHNYKRLFTCLPREIKSKIVNIAKERMTTSADYADLNKLLKTWSSNFIILRYPYEEYNGMTEEEYKELGITWVENGAKLENATFVYYPSELYGLIYAFKQIVHGFTANKAITANH